MDIILRKTGFCRVLSKEDTRNGTNQKTTFQQLIDETSKPDSQKDVNLILKLVAELRANNQQLSSLGMVTPIIATIKNIIDNNKEKIGNTSKFVQNNPVQYQNSEESIDTTTREGTSNQQYSGESTAGSTTERNINRKF